MACNGRSPRDGKLVNRGSGPSQHVGPVDGVDVGGLGELLARILLPCQSAMLRVVQLYDQPADSLALHLHIYQDSSAAISQPIQRVHIVDHDNFAPNLDLQYSHKRRIHDAPRLVGAERCHCPA